MEIVIKIVRLFLIIIFCVLLFQACPMDHGTIFLSLENNSNDTLAVYIADGSLTAYPDTLLPNNHNDVRLGGVPKGNMTFDIYSYKSGGSQEKFVKKNTISIFILDCNNAMNVKGLNWDYIWQEMNYGKRFLWRYDLSFNDIERLNFLLSYPPDERMKDMKMWPPYGSE